MKSILYTIIGIYFLICILLYFFQSKLLFIPSQLPADFKFHFQGDFEEKFFQVNENTTIHALHFFANNPKGVILYFHGNAGSLEGWGQVGEEFASLGYDVLISDYRTFGKSTGTISESAFYEDAQMLYDFLLEKYDPSQIIIYGRSIGTGVAIDLASKNTAQQLILETPFKNMTELAGSKMKIFPVKALLRFSFKSDEKILKVKYPIHIFHGTDDEVIPYYHAQDFATLLGNTEMLTTLENGGHNNLSDFSAYWIKIKALLKVN